MAPYAVKCRADSRGPRERVLDPFFRVGERTVKVKRRTPVLLNGTAESPAAARIRPNRLKKVIFPGGNADMEDVDSAENKPGQPCFQIGIRERAR